MHSLVRRGMGAGWAKACAELGISKALRIGRIARLPFLLHSLTELPATSRRPFHLPSTLAHLLVLEPYQWTVRYRRLPRTLGLPPTSIVGSLPIRRLRGELAP